MILPRRSAAAKLPPSREEVRGAKIAVGLVLGFLTLASAAMISELFVGWQTVAATITRLDAPRSCRSDRRALFGPKRRDWAPEASVAYCGIVYTDQGSFQLPETNRLIPAPLSRETLHDLLREGCRYDLQIYGYGFDLGPDALSSSDTQGTKTLWDAEPAGPCPALEAP